ncbi:hypothetical protein BSR28_00070 [Boudabousia liubingyangii]|uniref:hypothetical protein n=1 Tax=Boudabousia liubingyangii TaxID=1921764 RepID=UPI00093A6DAD|nr:hypothetical protein [Boudabousia liubingyangii]OKL48149.1 hypothetical protein BSR28_00070 [Boudabousia liubingyangii]
MSTTSIVEENPSLEGRTATVTIAGTEYTLVLSTGATRKIAARYGGLDQLGEKLLTGEDMDQALGEIIWIVTLLANQGIQIHNFAHPDDKQELLTEDLVELLTCPADLADYREAITAALVNGTRREIVSEAPVGKEQQAE